MASTKSNTTAASIFTVIGRVPQALSLLWEVDRKTFSLTTASTMLLGIIPVGIAYIGKLLIDHLVDGEGINSQLWLLVGLEFSFVIFASVLRQVYEVSQEMLREQTWQVLSEKTMRHAASLDLDFFELPENYNILSKAERELGFRPMYMITSLLETLRSFTTVMSFFVTIVTFQPILALVLLLAAIPTFFAARRSGLLTFNVYDETTLDSRRAAYLRSILTSDTSAKELRLLDLESRLLNQWQILASRTIAKRLSIAYTRAREFVVSDVAMTTAQYMGLLVVIREVALGKITVGDFMLVVAALSQVRQQLTFGITYFGELLEHSLFFGELTNFLNFRSKIVEPEQPKPIPSQLQHGLVLENITFCYSGAKNPVFENFSLELRAGEATAVVGVNGAGKTTLVKLLTRLYDPQEGRITLDGIDIREFDPKAYRELFSVTLQDFMRYQFTLKENITLGQAKQEVNRNWLQKAVTDARVLPLVESLSEGIDTQLGRAFEPLGRNLSGGEWQRIALARTLYRNSPILILDEPTASLDAEVESEIFGTYRSLTKGRLSLLITHRLNTVRMADRILLIKKGQVVEDGTHEALMARKGDYFRLFSTQASMYKESSVKVK